MNNSAVLLTALLAVSSAQATETHAVRIVSMQFEPADLIVKRGSRIVWSNEDLFPHTVTARDAAFDSGSIAAGSSWTYVVTQPGTYAYVCGLHPTMKGRMVVQ